MNSNIQCCARLLNWPLINNQTTTIIVTEDHNINLLVDREYLLKDGKLTVINSQDSRIYDLKPYKELKI